MRTLHRTLLLTALACVLGGGLPAQSHRKEGDRGPNTSRDARREAAPPRAAEPRADRRTAERAPVPDRRPGRAVPGPDHRGPAAVPLPPAGPRVVPPPHGGPRVMPPPHGGPRVMPPPHGGPRVVPPPHGGPHGDRIYGYAHPRRDYVDREGFIWIPGRGEHEGLWRPHRRPSRFHMWIPGHWVGDVWVNGHWSRHMR